MTDDITIGAVGEDLADKARSEVQIAVRRLAARSTLPGMLRAVAPGYGTEPSPLARRAIARLMLNEWQREENDAILAGRAEGLSWEQLAAADDDGGPDPHGGEKLFDLIAGPASLGWRPAIAWRCGGDDGCGELISDRGPYEGHPGNNESGHSAGCVRHAREVAAWLDGWADEDRERD